jgi:isoleucyl-tRNA synthetase
MDKITISAVGNEKIQSIINGNMEKIMSEVLDKKVEFGTLIGYTKKWNINGEEVELGVQK